MATLLDEMLAEAERDRMTTAQGGGVQEAPLLEGMEIRRSSPRRDSRGYLVEILDNRWQWHGTSMDYVYATTLLPGIVKGWALHKTHQDRYFVLSGTMEVVTFDPRPDSSTFGKICRVVMSGADPFLLNIPEFVWHADHNIGQTEVFLINVPTLPYDHANPDKYRLPIDTPLIPHSFGDAKGW